MIDLSSRRCRALRSHAHRFCHAQKGVAGIEFALIFPILLVIVAGSIDLSEALVARRKVTYIASSLAGFLADRNQWTKAEVDELLSAGSVIIKPFKADNLQIVLSVLQVTSDQKVKVVASQSYGTAALSVGSVTPVEVPKNIRTADVYTVLAQVKYSLSTPFSKLWPSVLTGNMFNFSTYYFARPRRSDKISIQ